MWGGHAGSCSCIQGSTLTHENEGKTNNLGWILYSVYAVLGVCCIRCQLMIMAWRIERDDLTLRSAMMVKLWTKKRELRMKMRTMWRIRADMRNQG